MPIDETAADLHKTAELPGWIIGTTLAAVALFRGSQQYILAEIFLCAATVMLVAKAVQHARKSKNEAPQRRRIVLAAVQVTVIFFAAGAIAIGIWPRSSARQPDSNEAAQTPKGSPHDS